MTHYANNCGRYQLPERLFPLTVVNLPAGKKIPVYGDGLQSRLAPRGRSLAVIRVRAGIAETVAWYVEHRGWWGPPLPSRGSGLDDG